MMTRLGVLLALLMAGLAWPLTAVAAPALVVQALELDGPLFQVHQATWQGRPAVSVVTRPRDGEQPRRMHLHLLRLAPQGLQALQSWPLPEGIGYVEPLRLPSGETGWLGWIKGRWHLGRVSDGTLVWRPACACATAYPAGHGPDRFRGRFAYDLDGDGSDELVLPTPDALEAYRILPPEMALSPMWRLRWSPTGSPLPAHRGGYDVPAFNFRDLRDGQGPALLLPQGERLLVARPPRVAGPSSYGWTDQRTAQSKDGALPETLRAARARLAGRTFPDAPALLAALRGAADGALPDAWLPHLPRVLAIARGGVPMETPYAAPFPALPPHGKGDDLLTLNVQDMDGDGVPDVLHATLLNKGSVFSQKNELRWYRGRLRDGRLTFPAPERTIRSDAGSFAMLLHPRTDDRPPLSLMMAFAQVSLASVMQALATEKVTLDVKIYDWRDSRLSDSARVEHHFTYEALRDKGRRAMFLAADLNGDGWRDYLLNPRPDQVLVYLSSGGAAGFGGPTLSLAGLALPSKMRYVTVGDLAGDGREALLIWYRPKEHPDLARTLRVLRLVDR